MPLETRIEQTLHSAITRATANTAPGHLCDALQSAVFPGGARIRPQLCLSVAQACGDPTPNVANAAAAAIELIHCGSLVHDDMPCFDDADLRRGKPSIHKAFGEPIAVLTGDTLIVQAFETLAHVADEAPERVCKLVALLARFTGSPHGICAGQAWESEDVVDLGAYHRAKTGAMFIAATQMGAVAGGADPELWYDLGARIGEAFQVADDLRDVVCDEAELGKPVGQDAVHSRPNAVQQLGLDGAMAHLNNILGGAIASIPSCPGEAQLCAVIQATSQRLAPTQLQQSTAAE